MFLAKLVVLCLFGQTICSENDHSETECHTKVRESQSENKPQSLLNTFDSGLLSGNGTLIHKIETKNNDGNYKKYETCNESTKSFCRRLSHLSLHFVIEKDGIDELLRDRRGKRSCITILHLQILWSHFSKKNNLN